MHVICRINRRAFVDTEISGKRLFHERTIAFFSLNLAFDGFDHHAVWRAVGRARELCYTRFQFFGQFKRGWRGHDKSG